MKAKTLGTLAAALALLCGAFAPTAQADFGIHGFDVRFFEEDGSPSLQAGSHPFAMETFFETNYTEVKPGFFEVEGGDFRDVVIETAKGFIGDATAVQRCSTLDFITIVAEMPSCPDNTAVGVTAAFVQKPGEGIPAAVFNLEPPSGVPLRLGFAIQGVPLVIDVSLKHSPDYNARAQVLNAPQPLTVFGSAVQLWGVPADPAHDFARGKCAQSAFAGDADEVIVDGRLNLRKGGPECSIEEEEKPFLTLPRHCEGPLVTNYSVTSWTGNFDAGSDSTPAFKGCDKLPFDPDISSRATVDTAGTGTGLDFEIDFEDETSPGSEGLLDPDGIASSEMKRVAVTLPAGMTVNPSIAEGLGVCTMADLDRETIDSPPSAGCPNASKIGTVEVETPIVEPTIEGEVFLAQQNDPSTAARENPFDSLIAFYIVLRNRELGALVKVPAKVVPDPNTGQLVTISEDVPQIPFFRFRFHFREGQRAPLISPPTCGTHTTKAEFTPWARPGETVIETATFQIGRGVGGGPCPSGGVPPFEPEFQAGSLNNSAAVYSPFLMRLQRADGEQDMTKFSAILPPGVTGKLAGVGKCSETQISAAKAKSGRAEQRSPSCPLDSQIGQTVAGAGVGSSLTYVGGKLYLAGPYKGAPLSVVAITPAVAGPFDVGTVVVRVGLDVNPKTAEVEVDGASSDPIPHILQGIPLKLRDLRVEVDRSGFTRNPTSCEEESTRATLFGANLNLFSAADDVPVALRSRYQAADCARLGFKPRLAVRLRGGTKRGDNPAFRAVLRPRPGDANIEAAVARFPRSAFLDQSHIRTICTRVQFAKDSCPKGSIYGRVRAFTPLLDQPLEGPAYLRSSSNELPDLVFDLRGLVDIEASARIDSVRGAIRATFPAVPDQPISKVVISMQGGGKGLIVNSRNLCEGKRSRLTVKMRGHNAKRAKLRPVLRARCGDKKKR